MLKACEARVWGGKRKSHQGGEDRVRWVVGVLVKQQVGMWLGGGGGRKGGWEKERVRCGIRKQPVTAKWETWWKDS